MSSPEWALGKVRLVQFAGDGVVHLAGEVDKTFRAADLVSMRRENGRLPEHPGPPFLLLTSGERIPLDREAGIVWKENRVEAVTRGLSADAKGSPVSVPLAYLALACLEHPHAAEESEMVLAKLLESKRKSDVILLTNGDQVEGRVLQRGPKSWEVQAGERTVELEVERIAVLAVNPDRLITPRAKKAYFRAVASNGARVDFLTLRLDQERGVLSGKTLFGASLEVPLKEVVALETRQGRAVFLSDLPAMVDSVSVPKGVRPLGLNVQRFGTSRTISDVPRGSDPFWNTKGVRPLGLNVQRFGISRKISDVPRGSDPFWNRHSEPALSLDWPMGRDRNVLSRALRLSDGVYDRGLSMTAGTSARFDLKGDYRWFEARVGMDARDGRLGRARLEVEIDGKKTDVGGELAASAKPAEVRLDVSGAKTLRLTVRAGSRVGVQPVVNWGNARLVK